MFITVAIDFLVQPKRQSRPPTRAANKKTEDKSLACSISSHLAVGLFNESMPITECPVDGDLATRQARRTAASLGSRQPIHQGAVQKLMFFAAKLFASLQIFCLKFE
jgi:hypothetical protein